MYATSNWFMWSRCLSWLCTWLLVARIYFNRFLATIGEAPMHWQPDFDGGRKRDQFLSSEPDAFQVFSSLEVRAAPLGSCSSFHGSKPRSWISWLPRAWPRASNDFGFRGLGLNSLPRILPSSHPLQTLAPNLSTRVLALSWTSEAGCPCCTSKDCRSSRTVLSDHAPPLSAYTRTRSTPMRLASTTCMSFLASCPFKRTWTFTLPL